MSSIGAMFAPHHQDVADELVRVCRPGGTIGLLSWTPEGMIGALFRTMGPFAPPPPPGAQPPPLWGSEEHLRELFGDRVEFHTLERDVLEITAFERPHDYGEHFKARYGPTIAARANAARDGREAEFDEALDRVLRRVEPRRRPTARASRRSTCSRSARASEPAEPGCFLTARRSTPRSPWPLENQRLVTVFLRVKNSTASGPWACRSPRNESFQPENGKKATGAATPMLTPIMPASTSWR